MATTASNVDTVPIFSGGKWAEISSDRGGDVFNPSTGKVIGWVPYSSVEQTNAVVEAAAAALPTWVETPVVERRD